MRATRLLAAFCVATLLSACFQANPVTMARLATLSPLTADPGDLAVIMELPDWATVAPGSARLSIYSTRSDTGQSLNQEFILSATPTASGGERYAVADTDLDRLRSAQETARQWEAEAPRANSGGFSASFAACIKPGETANPDDTYSLLIEVDPDTPPLSLVKNATVRSLLQHLETDETSSIATPYTTE